MAKSLRIGSDEEHLEITELPEDTLNVEVKNGRRRASVVVDKGEFRQALVGLVAAGADQQAPQTLGAAPGDRITG